MNTLTKILFALALLVGASPAFGQTGVAGGITGSLQVGGGGGYTGVTIGDTLSGCATDGYVLFNNAGTVGCKVLSGGGNVSNSGTPTAGQIAEWSDATTVLGRTVGGDCTYSAGSFTCTKTNGTAFATSATTDTTDAVNITSGTIDAARLPASPAFTSVASDRYTVTTSNTNAQSGTSYTVTSSDCGKNIIATNAAAITISMDTGLTAGCWVTITQGGAGQVTVAGTATVNSANGKKTRAQYSVINLMYGGATDTYILSGDSST